LCPAPDVGLCRQRQNVGAFEFLAVALPQLKSGSGSAMNTAVPAVPIPEPVASVSVLPRDGAAQVLLAGAGEGSRLVLVTGQGAVVAVTVTGLTKPSFTALDGRVAADFAGARVLVRVSVPAELRAATITLEGHVVATIREGHTWPLAAASDEGIELAVPVPSR
jgi:hypothetical protein